MKPGGCSCFFVNSGFTIRFKCAYGVVSLLFVCVGLCFSEEFQCTWFIHMVY